MSKTYHVYIMASARNGTLYIGITNDIGRRTYEHREGLVAGFTKKYGIKALVYYETFENVNDALHRKPRLKKFTRKRKMALIESVNPRWQDLALSL